MKPDFALSLSLDGIALLHRAAGGWRRVGAVALNVPDLAAALTTMREQAAALADGPVACKIVIPDDQIRYMSVETGASNTEDRAELIRSALEEATPYSLDDLAFDCCDTGSVTHLAAVARDTLAEAEQFAIDHGFQPTSFVAIPGDGPFLGEPFFGPSTLQEAAGVEVEPDGIAVVEIGDVLESETPPDMPEIGAVAGFASRRHKPEGEASVPALGGASRSRSDTPDLPREESSSVSKRENAPAGDRSVRSPRIDMPDAAPRDRSVPEKAPNAAKASSAAGGGFLSRRKKKPLKKAHKTRKSAAAQVAAMAPDRPPEVIPDATLNEADRLTVFGARKSRSAAQGRPRHLALILTAILLIFLAAVAAWAALFPDSLAARLLFRAPDQSELAQEPEPDVAPGEVVGPNQIEGPALIVVPDAEDLLPPRTSALSPETDTDSGTDADLTGTDGAVLDALRGDDPSEPDVPTDPNTVAQAIQDKTGAWVLPPDPPGALSAEGRDDLDDLYIASIDGPDLAQDALALASPEDLVPDTPPGIVSSPAAPGTQFTLDTRDLVVPTAAGSLNPDGVMVFLGRPPVTPAAFPDRGPAVDEEPPVDPIERLAELRPRPRPENLVELNERARLGGRSLEELSGVRPRARPLTEKQVAEQDETPTANAVVVSRLPRFRPANLDTRSRRKPAQVATTTAKATPGTTQQPASVATIAPRTVKPKIPSTASVARRATLKNAINLKRINLIGVYGTPSKRRALVRLPSGRYQKVKVGDRIDGGRVVAIGDSELRYQKGGRNLTLKMPKG